MQRFILSLIMAILPSIATAGGVCSSSLFVQAASVPVEQYGTAVTVGLLGRIDRAEAALHRLGLRQVRVRHYGDTARLEVELADIPTVLGQREAVVAAVRSAGYRYVTLDLEGFRSGNLND